MQERFWQYFDTSAKDAPTVLYADNIEGSAFKAGDAASWSLRTLPTAGQSLLRHMTHSIPGITAPMLYYGMVFAHFCWHVEDLFMHSINFLHSGAPKVWYGVGAAWASKLEAYFKDVVRVVHARMRMTEYLWAVGARACLAADCCCTCRLPPVCGMPGLPQCELPLPYIMHGNASCIRMQVFKNSVAELRRHGLSEACIQARVNDALAQKTVLVNPAELQAAGIPVTRLVQRPGDLIVTFPKGYHAGFSCGNNIGEAANFALPSWADFGIDGALRALRLRSTPVRKCKAVWDRLLWSCLPCVNVARPVMQASSRVLYVGSTRKGEQSNVASQTMSQVLIKGTSESSQDQSSACVQIVSIEHLACADALELHQQLLQSFRASASSALDRADGGAQPARPEAAFKAWLCIRGAVTVMKEHKVQLVVAFCQLMRWYHRCLSVLHLCGDCSMRCVELGIVKCQHTGELLHLAAVAEGVGADGCWQFASLGDALQRPAAHGIDVRVHTGFGKCLHAARDLSHMCLAMVRCSLRFLCMCT